MFENYVVTKEKGGGTSVVLAKWALITKSIMTQ